MNRTNIAIVFGGDSSEREISEKSSLTIEKDLDRNRYNVYRVGISKNNWSVVCCDGSEIPIDKKDFSFKLDGERIQVACALIIIHGSPGENGILQSYFDLIGLPYTSCSAFVSALTFDKYACKCYLRDSGIAMAKEVLVKAHEQPDPASIVQQLQLPLFVKPNAGGSSFGIQKIHSADQLESALQAARIESAEVLIESFIKGREFSHGIYLSANRVLHFPVTEIKSEKEFFDYEAKYVAGMSQEITPADLTPDQQVHLQELTEKIARRLACKGLVRVDYILKDQQFYFLEINTVPGMSEMSIIPQQIRSAGYTVSQVLDYLISDSL